MRDFTAASWNIQTLLNTCHHSHSLDEFHDFFCIWDFYRQQLESKLIWQVTWLCTCAMIEYSWQTNACTDGKKERKLVRLSDSLTMVMMTTMKMMLITLMRMIILMTLMTMIVKMTLTTMMMMMKRWSTRARVKVVRAKMLAAILLAGFLILWINNL